MIAVFLENSEDNAEVGEYMSRVGLKRRSFLTKPQQLSLYLILDNSLINMDAVIG